MRALLLLPLVLTLAGCAGYKLGPTNGLVAGSKSVDIRPFINQTLEPRVTEYVAEAIRKQVQRDGTYKLETQGVPDIQVNGVITHFERAELAYQPKDVLTPLDYNLRLTAEVVAIDRNTGKTNFSGVVYGRTSIRVGKDQTSAERQAIPLLAEDLARNLVSQLADGTW